MAAAAIADFLTDFGAGRPRTATPPPQAPALAVVEPEEAKPDVDAIIGAAVALAERELTDKLEALHEARLQAERDAHAEELEALRAKQGEELGARLAEAMRELEGKIVAVSSEATARVLAHLLSDQVAARAIDELARTIRGAVAEVDAVRIRVRGPQSLFLPLAEAMGELAKHLEFSESAGTDLTVTIDETLFETRLGDWSAALAEVIG